jgi:hypothetical protein
MYLPGKLCGCGGESLGIIGIVVGRMLGEVACKVVDWIELPQDFFQ